MMVHYVDVLPGKQAMRFQNDDDICKNTQQISIKCFKRAV